MQQYNNNLTIKKSPTKGDNLKKILPILFSIIVFSIIGLLISNPARYNKSIISGFMLFANCVFPGLFPFLVLTKILTELGTIKLLSTRLTRVTQRAYNVPGEAGFVFIMSALCGYPMGARLTADLIKNKAIPECDALKVLSFCSVSGPIFAIGTVGVAMFKSFKVGAIIYVSHIISSLLIGLIFCRSPQKNVLKTPSFDNPSKIKKLTQTVPATQPASIDKIISDGVYSAISTITIVGAFVTLFFMLIDMLSATNILLPLENLINSGLHVFGESRSLGRGVVCGIVEMTRGCSELAKFGISASTVSLASLLLSFSGLSIIMQSLTLLSGIKIKIGKYFLQKITHALLCMGLTYLICLIAL